MKKTEDTRTLLDDQLKQLDQDIIWTQKQKAKLHFQILSNLDKWEVKSSFLNSFRFVSSLVLCTIILAAGYLFLSQNIFQENGGRTTGNSTDEHAVSIGVNEVDIEKSKETIRAVIVKEFDGPDDKYMALWSDAMEAQNNVETQEEFDALQKTPVWQDYMDYMAETYSSYFTENGYENFINATPAFMYSNFEGDYQMSTSDIKIQPNEKNSKMYHFTFIVQYKNSREKVNQYNFEGKAFTSKGGKIERLEFLDIDDLLQDMNENNMN